LKNGTRRRQQLADLEAEEIGLNPETIEEALVKFDKKHTPEYVYELMENIAKTTHATGLDDEINELVKVGNLQEIIWRLRDEGMADKADHFEKYLVDTLKKEEIISISDIDEGDTRPQLVELANRVRGVYKNIPGHKVGREVAMYRLDKLIGTNAFPITVQRTIDGKLDSVQLLIEKSASGSEIRKITGNLDGRPPAEIKTLRLLGHDWDRNANNFMFPTKGRAFAIDGESSFSKGSNAGLSSVTWEDMWNHFVTEQGYGYLTDSDLLPN